MIRHVLRIRKSAMGAPYEYACALLGVEGPLRKQVIDWAKNKVSDESVYTDKLIKGREDEPHITVKWGLDIGSKQLLAKTVKAFGSVKAKLGKVEVFDRPEKYDVVVVKVVSEDIKKLNALIEKKMKHTTTYPLSLHVTLAYVKKGHGKSFVGNTDFEGKDVLFSSLLYSGKNGKKVRVPLTKSMDSSSIMLIHPSGREESLAKSDFSYVLMKAIPKGDLKSLYARGARWITLKTTGSHLLILPAGEGKFKVIAGAGGKLDHLTLSNIKDPKEYKEKAKMTREEKKKKSRAKQEKMSPEQLVSERKKVKDIKVEKKKVVERRQKTMADITGITHLLTDTEKKSVVKEAERKATEEVDGKEPALEGKEKKNAVKKVVEKAVLDAEKIKAREALADQRDLINRARDIVARDLIKTTLDELPIPDAEKQLAARETDFVEGSDGELLVRPKDASFIESKSQIKLTPEMAEEIWLAHKGYQAELKAINKNRPILDAKLTDPNVYGHLLTPDEARKMALNEHIQIQRATMNAEFHEKVAAYDNTLMRRSQVTGGVATLNGLSSGILGEAIVDEDIVKKIGVAGAAQMIAHQIWEKGAHKELIEGLAEDIMQRNLPIVEDALKYADEMAKRHDALKEMGRKGALQPRQVSGNNLYNIRQGIQRLGTASGSLEASATLLHALMREPKDVIRVDAGTVADSARARAKSMGLKRGEYSLEKSAGRYNLTIPSSSYGKVIKAAQAREYNRNTAIANIKNYSQNEKGWLPAGIKTTNPDTGKPVELTDGQQAGIRFAMENMKQSELSGENTSGTIWDFKPGTGKSLMSIGAIGEAIDRGHARRAILTVPSRLVGEFKDQLRQWGDGKHKFAVLDPNNKEALRAAINDPNVKVVLVGQDSLRAQHTSRSRKGRGQYAEERKAHYIKTGMDDVAAGMKAHEDLKNLDKTNTVAKALNQAGNFDLVVADEAHEMFGRGEFTGPESVSMSQRSRAMQSLDVKHRVAMTGTVTRSSMENYVSMANWVKPGQLVRENFIAKWGNVNQGTTMFQNAAREAFRQETDHYLFSQELKLKAKLSTKKSTVRLSDTQNAHFAKAEQKKLATMRNPRVSNNHKKAVHLRTYNAHRKTIYNRDHRTNALVQSIVKKTAADVKAGKSGIFFAYNIDALKTTGKALEEKHGKGTVGYFTGSESPANREKLKKKFNEGKIKFLLGTHQTMGTGHNLQHAGFAVNIDTPQTAADQDQRNRRMYRKGQTKDTTIYDFSTATPQSFRAEDRLRRGERTLQSFGNPGELDESGIGRALQAARTLRGATI